MAEKKLTIRKLAEHIDRPETLVAAVLDGSHIPSLTLAESLLHGVSHEFEVIRRK